jgi:predicted Ser/Thr protein kinase
MIDEKKCGQCGAPLTAGTPEGLCPACLLKRALDTQTAGAGLGADFTPPPPEDLARFFPQLEILELLGRGGMGVVYKARQRDLDRMVALKILPSATDRDPAFAERFAREARALARLGHPNIVAIYESGQTGGLFYFVMEYVDGLNLRQLLVAAKMTPREALAIVPQICEALQTAHDQGIVHRDIKPENILLDKKGRVKIADFGIAKIVGGDEKDMTLTGAGEMMGTPAYMAPEQIEHPLEVDHRADIYSLGVVFYQMLTGELPLGKFAPPSRIRGMQIDVRLDEVVLRALEKEPELRYQQASEVRTQVETIAASPDAGSPREVSPKGAAAPESPVSPERLSQMRRKLAALGLLMAVSGVVEAHFIYNLVEPALGIAVAAAALLFAFAVLTMAAWAGRSFARVKAASQVTSVGGIGVLGIACRLAWNTDGLPTPWRICLLTMFGLWILSGLVHLASIGPFARNLWILDQRERQPVGAVAFCLAAMSGLTPTFCYWLQPWVAPWLSPAEQEFALLLTLWAGVNAIALGLGARKSLLGCVGAWVGAINVSIWTLMAVAGLGGDRHLPELLQDCADDIRPDGTIHYVETSSVKNHASVTVDQDEFNASSIVQVDTLTDAGGHPLRFETRRGNGDLIHYTYYLNQPVPPGGMLTNIMEGTMMNLIQPTGNPGEFEYHMDHSPGYSGVTRRIETHRLPSGAVLIDKSPKDLKVMTVGDHLELFIDRRIPGGDDIDIRFRYRLANSNLQRKSGSATPSNNPVQNGGNAEETVSEITKAAPEPVEQILEEYDWSALAAAGRVNPGMLAGIGGYQMFLVTNTTDAAMQWPVLKIDKPPITSMHYALTGEIKYDGVQGAGYLEMWSYFPPAGPGQPEGQFFSRTLGGVGSGPIARITGTSDWRTFELPFDRTGLANPPTRLEVNIFLPGRGVVFIDSLKLTQLLEPKETQASAASPESSGTSH